MRKSPLLLTMVALAFGWITEAQAQALSQEDLLRCQELLATLEPGQPETLEQQECLALLAQLGVQAALADDFDITDSPH